MNKIITMLCMFLACGISASNAEEYVVFGQNVLATGAVKTQTASVVPGGSANGLVVLTFDLGALPVGHVFFVDAFVLLTKGAVAGDTLCRIRTIGEGLALSAMDTIDLEDRRFHPANTNTQIQLSGFFRVVTPGSASLKMECASAGSDATITRSGAQMRVYR